MKADPDSLRRRKKQLKKVVNYLLSEKRELAQFDEGLVIMVDACITKVKELSSSIDKLIQKMERSIYNSKAE